MHNLVKEIWILSNMILKISEKVEIAQIQIMGFIIGKIKTKILYMGTLGDLEGRLISCKIMTKNYNVGDYFLRICSKRMH